MFDKETRWFIRCDTCPDDAVALSPFGADKDLAALTAREDGWLVLDGLHSCYQCQQEGRTERVS